MKKSENIQYSSIQQYPLSISEKGLAALLEKSRFDPRLMEVTTEFIRDFWWNLDPVKINKACKRQRSPFIVKGVLSAIWDNCEGDAETRKLFAKWADLVTRSIKNPSPQLVYLNLYGIGSNGLRHQLDKPNKSFLKHGLIISDLPFNKGKPGIIKSKTNLPENKVSELELLKIAMTDKIKQYKTTNNLSNEALSKKTGINRVYLSKILNNKIEGITADYLESAIRNIS